VHLVSVFEQTIGDLENALQVGHVATSPLAVAHPSQTIAAVRAWAAPAAINNVPVQRDGHIVAVVENVNGDVAPSPNGIPPRAPSDGQAVKAVARPLAGDMLIEARMPLGQLMAELVQPPHYRLVVNGGRMDSIVTPSDLGKLPMRVLAYTALTHLEATMIQAIRRIHPTDEDAVARLNEGAQAQVLGDLDRMHAKKLEPSLLEVTNLQQKGLILYAAGIYRGDRTAVADEFDELYEKLRNPLMHAASFVDDSLEALARLKRQLEVIRQRTAQAATALGSDS